MSRRSRIVTLFAALYVLQVVPLAYWYIETRPRITDMATAATALLVMGVTHFFSARFYLRSIDRASAMHAALRGEELERSLELYRAIAEHEELLIRRICSAIESELGQAQDDLERGRITKVEERLQHSLDLASAGIPVRCQNETIDAVLEAVSQQFTSKGVTLTVKASVPTQIELPDMVIAAMLFGLADEALGNCDSLRDEDPSSIPTASIRLATNAGQLLIEAESPKHAASKSKHGPTSDNRGKPRKGVQIWSTQLVEDFARSWGGIAEHTEEGGLSRTSLMIPLDLSSEE